jgi:hypothetical protein
VCQELRRLKEPQGAVIEFGRETAKKRRLAIEDLMKPANVAISDVQTLKTKRDELFRQFVAHPRKLSLATEIKIIDDQIAEESRAKKKARTEQTK